jgi:hypothetical protein
MPLKQDWERERDQLRVWLEIMYNVGDDGGSFISHMLQRHARISLNTAAVLTMKQWSSTAFKRYVCQHTENTQNWREEKPSPQIWISTSHNLPKVLSIDYMEQQKSPNLQWQRKWDECFSLVLSSLQPMQSWNPPSHGLLAHLQSECTSDDDVCYVACVILHAEHVGANWGSNLNQQRWWIYMGVCMYICD